MSNRQRSFGISELAMLSPMLLYVLSFTLLPIVSTLIISFTDRYTHSFPALKNYELLFSESGFSNALFNTVVLTVIGVAVEVCVGLGIAVAMTSLKRGRQIFRTSFLIPIGVPTLVAGVVMTYIFASNGYMNEILMKLGFISHPLDWKSGGVITYCMIILADMWKVTPLVVLLLLAGLEQIPRDYYEAARVDGAGSWSAFRHITLPLLKPTITMVVILRVMDAFRIFELPMILVGRSFPVVGTFAYYEFADYNNIHASAAAAALLFFMILVSIVVYLSIAERRHFRRVEC